MLNKRVHADYSSIVEPKSEFTEITVVSKMERDVKSSTVRHSPMPTRAILPEMKLSSTNDCSYEEER